MKKFSKLLLAATFALAFFVVLNVNVNAHEHEEPTDRKVVVHYHRWDSDYEDKNIWTWGTGENGSEAPVVLSDVDEFGGVFEIFVDEDADDEIGLILRYEMGWGDGQNDRDGLVSDDDPSGDTPNKFITIKEDGDFVGFNEDGVKHVFVYEGMADVIYQDDLYGPLREDTGTLAVIFYDPDEYAVVEEYDIWTWGYGLEDELEPVPFKGVLGVDGQLESQAMFRVAHIPIGADADDEIGVIFRTAGAWGEFQTDDLNVDVSDIKGGGFKTVFFGMEEQFDTFEMFENFAMPATIDAANALDPNSALIEFNKGITVLDEDDEGEMFEIFDLDWFTVLDNDGNEVDIQDVSFTQGQQSVSEFVLLFDDNNALNAADAPYTIIFQSDPDNEETRTEATLEISDEAPTIRIVGSTSPELELGDSYSLPAFSATEVINEESRPLYDVYVKEGHGYLSTREAGVYDIVIEATDTFGNVATETISVTVTDPCDPEAHLNNNTIQNVVYATFSGLSIILAGAWFIARRAKGGRQ